MTPIKNSIAGLLFLSIACSSALPQDPADPGLQDSLLRWLDSNNDGTIDACEGAEAFLHLVDESDHDGDGSVTADEIALFFAEQEAGDVKEQQQIFEELDANGDRSLGLTEIPEEYRPLLPLVDTDGNKAVCFSEFLNAPVDDPSFFLEQEAISFMNELDGNGDGIVELSDLPRREREELAGIDQNGDGQLTREEFMAAVEEELRGAVFAVEGRAALMHGVIGPSTPGRVLELILEFPEVDTIVMEEVPGSMDDDSNLRAARLVRRRGFTTIVPSGGMIASGGTDFFLAGVRRIVEPGGMIGVHSWDGFNEEGRDLPEDHPEHAKYLDYYREMGVPSDFYRFTLEAAPADDIHWMTAREISRFAVASDMDESDGRDEAYGLGAIDVSRGARGVVPLPEGTARVLRDVFDRYTRVMAPNNKPIHILAQSSWTEDQIVRARKVLEHLLADVPGSLYGSDKSAVANAMSDRRATLVLFDTKEAMERAFEGDLGELHLGMQDLRANECPVEGSRDYMAHETRDAAFEEILHLVHDYGIRPALPLFDAAIQRCSDHAEEAGLWDPWPRDEPDNFRNEYIAAVYDNYLDLWTLPPTVYEGQAIGKDDIPEGASHFGAYRAGSRQRLSELDPDGLALVEKFFPPALTYAAELPEEFAGVFKLCRDPALRYTMKSQHLRRVTLRGDRPAGLVGNDHGNDLFGNSGDNVLEGRGGDDILYGDSGEDTAVFRGASSEYDIRFEKGSIRVSDSRKDRDGSDLLEDMEWLRFADRVVGASESAGERRDG